MGDHSQLPEKLRLDSGRLDLTRKWVAELEARRKME